MENKKMWTICRVVGIIITALFVLLSFGNILAAGLQLGREGAVLALLLSISYVYIIYGFAKNYRAPIVFWLAWFPILYVPVAWYIISLAEIPLGSSSFLLMMALPGVWYLISWKWGAGMPSVRVSAMALIVAVVLIVVPAFFLANSFIKIDTSDRTPYPDTPQSANHNLTLPQETPQTAYYEFEIAGQGTPFELEFLQESYRCDSVNELYQTIAEVGGYCLRETRDPAFNAETISYRLSAPREGLQGYILGLRARIFFQDCTQYDQDEQAVCESEQAPWRSPLVIETLKEWFETYADEAVEGFIQ